MSDICPGCGEPVPSLIDHTWQCESMGCTNEICENCAEVMGFSMMVCRECADLVGNGWFDTRRGRRGVV